MFVGLMNELQSAFMVENQGSFFGGAKACFEISYLWNWQSPF